MTLIDWWPHGHQFPLDTTPLSLHDQSPSQAVLDQAEMEADHAQALLDRACLNDASLVDLDRLWTEATQARRRYYTALNADLAP